MPSQSTTIRRAARATLMVAAIVTTACIDVHDASDEAAKRAADSAGGAVFIGDAKPNAATPSPDTYGPDSATPVRGFGPAKLDSALQTDSTHSLVIVDSTPAARPTDADLAALQRELGIPVAGLARGALHDTFNEMRGGTRPHEALDIPAPRGTPVLSAAPGRVLKLFNSKPGGLMVYAADSTERFILMYGHLDAYQPGLAEGQAVRRGQQIGVVGTTGNAAPTVPHLHFAIARSGNVMEWWKGAPVNPYPLLR
jgi:murein DD-endopeptidase MepM/ murein hydrolase activator NlpD